MALVDITPDEAATAFENCFIEERLPDETATGAYSVSASYNLFKSCPTQKFSLAPNSKALLKCTNFDPRFAAHTKPENCPGTLISVSKEIPPVEKQYFCFSNNSKVKGTFVVRETHFYVI